MFDLDFMGKQMTYDKQKKHTTTSGKYFISTNNTFDHGWETMVFSRNPQSGDIDYAEIDVTWYESEEDAYDGHDRIISKWESK